MLKKYSFLLFLFLPNTLFAFDCSKFKFDVDVNLTIKTEDVKIKKSDKDLVGMLGYAAPQLSYEVPYQKVPIRVHDGYCVALRWVDVNILQTFDIVIDRNLKENSCAYNLVLKHETDHINVSKKILKENEDYIKKSVASVANNMEPIFIKDLSELDNSSDFYDKIKENDVIKKMQQDIKDKIKTENDKIDERGDNYDIWKCDDFYKDMKNKAVNGMVVID